jgi:hypothetical protein
MKINIPDTDVPLHWRRLQPIIERDNQLRPDVTAIVGKKSCAFFDGAGRKLAVAVPARFTSATITNPNRQLALVAWLWRTFPREPLEGTKPALEVSPHSEGVRRSETPANERFP